MQSYLLDLRFQFSIAAIVINLLGCQVVHLPWTGDRVSQKSFLIIRSLEKLRSTPPRRTVRLTD